MEIPCVITVAHQKGGVGKSTIASNLAAEYFKEYGEALTVIDLDTQRSLTYFNNIRRFNDIAELPIVQVQSADELEALIDANKGVILIDAGGFDSRMNRIAMAYSDLIITPVSDSSFELGGLMIFQEMLADIRKDVPGLIATVLLNRVHQFAGKSLEDIFDFVKENAEFSYFETILRDRGEYKRATENGKSVVELASDGKAAREINSLIKEIGNMNPIKEIGYVTTK